jgi:hypothetical protein
MYVCIYKSSRALRSANVYVKYMLSLTSFQLLAHYCATMQLHPMPALPLLMLTLCLSFATSQNAPPSPPSLVIATLYGLVEGAWQHNPYSNTSG